MDNEGAYLSSRHPIKFLPGTAAQIWHSRAAKLFAYVSVPSGLGVLVLLIARDPASSLWVGAFFALLAILIVSVLASVILGPVVGQVRERAELKSGYTTVVNGNREYPQLAPGTSVVIRAPGAPFLSFQAYKEAWAAARESALP